MVQRRSESAFILPFVEANLGMQLRSIFITIYSPRVVDNQSILSDEGYESIVILM